MALLGCRKEKIIKPPEGRINQLTFAVYQSDGKQHVTKKHNYNWKNKGGQ